VPVGGTCPAGGTFGGTINLGQPQFVASQLNWNGVVYPQGGLSCTVGSQCGLMAVSPHLGTPFVVNYNFNVQHTFTSNLSLEVGYVGNHGDNLQNMRDINQCIPNPDGNCVRPYSGKFPYLAYINYTDNFSRSNYNSLQATLTQRASHGLDFTAGYTYGHGLDNGSLNFQGNVPQNSFNPNAEYASSDFDIRHRFTLTASYAIPGKKGFGQLLEGWKINTIVNLQSAQPWNVIDGSNGWSGTGDSLDRWDFFGTPSDFKVSSISIPFCSGFTPGQGLAGVTCTQTSGNTNTPIINLPVSLANACLAKAPDMNSLAQGGCYVDGKSVMVPPTLGTFGTMGRNIFRDAGFKNVDFSVFKTFSLKERFNAQFRVEFFNALNHPIIANPFGSVNGARGGSDPSSGATFGCACTTPDVAAGNPIVGSGSSRQLQLGLKLTF
jgi:hypothetical protein